MKKKTTVYLDADVLMAAKAAALTSNRSESALIEDAVRSYLRRGHGRAASNELGRLVARAVRRSDLDEDTALAQAVSEVRAVRRQRRQPAVRPRLKG
ncbi:MAG: ribbon-helix-helix domain-containing protein [Acidothermus sp.]|nr:ribbon-helix-helix domain-containing protein [Acidothermus sp.]